MKTPGTRVRVGVGVRVCVGVGSVPVIVGVLDAVGVIVIVPVMVGVRDGVGVIVNSSFWMIGKYVVDCREARAMITKPDTTTIARTHFSNGEEAWLGGDPFIET